MPYYPFKGRGLVKLDAVELGNVHDLTLTMQVNAFARYTAELTAPEPTIEHYLHVPAIIRVSMILSDYAAANLRAVVGGGGSGGTAEVVGDLDNEYELTFDGENCAVSPATDFDFVAYKFLPEPNISLPIISAGRGAAPLNGILLPDNTKTGTGISKFGKFTVA